jgi:diacylglycerol O-acyltransferase-1
MRRKRFSALSAILVSFFISAVFHEYLAIGIMGKVNGIAFFMMIVNVPIMMCQRAAKHYVSGNTNNILYWLSYLVLG